MVSAVTILNSYFQGFAKQRENLKPEREVHTQTMGWLGVFCVRVGGLVFWFLIFSFSFFFCKPNSKNWFDFLLLSYSAAEEQGITRSIGRSCGFRFFSLALPSEGGSLLSLPCQHACWVCVGGEAVISQPLCPFPIRADSHPGSEVAPGSCDPLVCVVALLRADAPQAFLLGPGGVLRPCTGYKRPSRAASLHRRSWGALWGQYGLGARREVYNTALLFLSMLTCSSALPSSLPAAMVPRPCASSTSLQHGDVPQMWGAGGSPPGVALCTSSLALNDRALLCSVLQSYPCIICQNQGSL